MAIIAKPGARELGEASLEPRAAALELGDAAPEGADEDAEDEQERARAAFQGDTQRAALASSSELNFEALLEPREPLACA